MLPDMAPSKLFKEHRLLRIFVAQSVGIDNCWFLTPKLLRMLNRNRCWLMNHLVLDVLLINRLSHLIFSRIILVATVGLMSPLTANGTWTKRLSGDNRTVS